LKAVLVAGGVVLVAGEEFVLLFGKEFLPS
jgi:hypothetical protein